MKRVTNILLIILFVLAGCANKSNHQKSRVQHKDIVIERFDKDFLDCLNDKGSASQLQLMEKYPVLLPAFGKVIVNTPDDNQKTFFKNLTSYFSDTTLKKIYVDAVKKFDNTEKIESELTAANDRLWEILPGKQLPRFCMHVSGFKQNVIVTDSVISISIDKYLGENYPIYKDFFYDYQRSQMKPEFITRDYLRAYVISSLQTEIKNPNLMSAMISEGKCLYVISKLLPDISTEDLIGYDEKQVKWSKANERAIWRTTIERKYLYNNDYMIISKYMNEAPNTSLISPLSPGRIGSWIGLQIVRNFVKNNPNVAVADILKMDEHKLLELSKYNP